MAESLTQEQRAAVGAISGGNPATAIGLDSEAHKETIRRLALQNPGKYASFQEEYLYGTIGRDNDPDNFGVFAKYLANANERSLRENMDATYNTMRGIFLDAQGKRKAKNDIATAENRRLYNGSWVSSFAPSLDAMAEMPAGQISERLFTAYVNAWNEKKQAFYSDFPRRVQRDSTQTPHGMTEGGQAVYSTAALESEISQAPAHKPVQRSSGSGSMQ